MRRQRQKEGVKPSIVKPFAKIQLHLPVSINAYIIVQLCRSMCGSIVIMLFYKCSYISMLYVFCPLVR